VGSEDVSNEGVMDEDAVDEDAVDEDAVDEDVVDEDVVDEVEYALHLARARRGMSQREFAAYLGITKSRLARLECGAGMEALRAVQRLLDAAGFALCVTDRESELWPWQPETWEHHDEAGRRFPAHHDVRRRGLRSYEEWRYRWSQPAPTFGWSFRGRWASGPPPTPGSPGGSS
jgi:transcriptional regulator with XRE-family HTH domain